MRDFDVELSFWVEQSSKFRWSIFVYLFPLIITKVCWVFNRIPRCLGCEYQNNFIMLRILLFHKAVYQNMHFPWNLKHHRTVLWYGILLENTKILTFNKTCELLGIYLTTKFLLTLRYGVRWVQSFTGSILVFSQEKEM